MKRILSCGAGVQSTTLVLMSLRGDIPPFDHIVFADTGWEPPSVYAHLERLQAEVATAGQVISVVTAGSIRDDHLDPQQAHLFIRNARKYPEYTGKQRTFIPFFVQADGTPDNPSGKGKTFRTCTKTYKIEPIELYIRSILGLRPRQRWPLEPTVLQTLGISWDESQRMRLSQRPAIVNDYPLIDMRMTRDDCHTYLKRHGWSAPRSACIGCPFHRNDEWRRMRSEEPEAWADAVHFDYAFRKRVRDGLTPIRGIPYLHDSRRPLDEAPIDEKLSSGAEPSEGSFFQDTMFGEDCDGFCGT